MKRLNCFLVIICILFISGCIPSNLSMKHSLNNSQFKEAVKITDEVLKTTYRIEEKGITHHLVMDKEQFDEIIDILSKIDNHLQNINPREGGIK